MKNNETFRAIRGTWVKNQRSANICQFFFRYSGFLPQGMSKVNPWMILYHKCALLICVFRNSPSHSAVITDDWRHHEQDQGLDYTNIVICQWSPFQHEFTKYF